MDYKSSGVNIDKGNEAVNLIKNSVKSTYTPNVLSSLGGFAAGVELPLNKYKQPVLVSCTDGVGTKLRIAIENKKLDTIGIDCVAMSVNDLICMGAAPLFFLDYIACHSINPDEIKTIVEGVAEGCRQSNCALVGGEMAEMNDMYQQEDFDIAGFCVGVVEKDAVITGKNIEPGHAIYSLASSGIHSNGYSLVRKIMNETDFLNNVSIETVLEPTKIYVKDIFSLIDSYSITGIANITGGGIGENLSRVIPEGVCAHIDKSLLHIPEVFKQLQHFGHVEESEMFRVFNMGVGMIIVSPDEISYPGLTKIGIIKEGQQGGCH